MTHDDIRKSAELFLENAKSGNAPIGDLLYILKALKGIRDNYEAFVTECQRLIEKGETVIRIVENYGNTIKLVKESEGWYVRTNLYAFDLGIYSGCRVHRSVQDYEVRRYFTTLIRRVSDRVYRGSETETNNYIKEELGNGLFERMPQIRYTRFLKQFVPMRWDGVGDLSDPFLLAVEGTDAKNRVRVTIKFNPNKAFTWMDRQSVVNKLMTLDCRNVKDVYSIDNFGVTFEVSVNIGYGLESALKDAIVNEVFSMLSKLEELGNW